MKEIALTVTVGREEVRIAAENPRRLVLLVQNFADTDVVIRMQVGAERFEERRLSAGFVFEAGDRSAVCLGAVYAVRPSGVGDVGVVEESSP